MSEKDTGPGERKPIDPGLDSESLIDPGESPERHPIERVLAREQRLDSDDPAEFKRREAARKLAFRKARARAGGHQESRRWFFILTGVCGFIFGYGGVWLGLYLAHRAHQLLRVRMLALSILGAILTVAVSAGLNRAYAAYRRSRAVSRASESSRPAPGPR